MATFERRASGWWQAKIRRKGFPDQSKTFEKKDDALKWARDIEGKIDRNVFTDQSEAEKTTLFDALDKYEREVSVHKKSHDHEKCRIGQLKKTTLAPRLVVGLRGTDFTAYMNERLKEVSPATVCLDLALLSHLYTIAAKKWNWGIPNPVMLVIRPKIKNARDRRFEEGEQKKIMAALDGCRNPYIKPIAELAIETGARMSELRELEWRYVEFEKQTARFVDTKNGDDRVIPLSTAAIAILKALPRDTTGFIFPVSKDSVSHAFARACVRAGVKDFKFHDLRHEGVSRLFEKDLNIMEVAAVSGHKTLSMLQRYTHLRAEKLAKKLG